MPVDLLQLSAKLRCRHYAGSLNDDTARPHEVGFLYKKNP